MPNKPRSLKIRRTLPLTLVFFAILACGVVQFIAQQGAATLILQSRNITPRGALTFDGLFYETAQGRTILPAALTSGIRTVSGARWTGQTQMPDGRMLRLSVTPQ